MCTVHANKWARPDSRWFASNTMAIKLTKKLKSSQLTFWNHCLYLQITQSSFQRCKRSFYITIFPNSFLLQTSILRMIGLFSRWTPFKNKSWKGKTNATQNIQKMPNVVFDKGHHYANLFRWVDAKERELTCHKSLLKAHKNWWFWTAG